MADASAPTFLSGLLRPSLASVVGAIVFALAEFVAACYLVTPTALARIEPELIAVNRSDEYARMTIEALRLKYLPHTGIHVIYAGPSTARLALVDAQHPHDLDVALTASVGEQVTFHNFTADGLTVDELLIILDYIPRDLKGVVVFTMSDTRFQGHRPKERLGLDQPSLGPLGDDIGGAPDFRTGVYFLDHLGFFATRRAAASRLTPMDEIWRPIFINKRAPPQVWVRAAHLAQIRNAAVINRQVFEAATLGSMLRSRGVLFVVMEAPTNPRFEALKPPELRNYYEERITAFSQKWEIPYWDLSGEAALTPEDFFDPIHVGVASGRERYQVVFLRYLSGFLREHLADLDAPKKPVPPLRVLPNPGGE